MSFRPDQEPVIKQNIETFPSIADAAARAFALFGEEIKWNTRVPEVTEQLLKRGIIFPSFDGNPYYLAEKGGDGNFWWMGYSRGFFDSKRDITDTYTPNSPLILPDNVGKAQQLVTVTYNHHYLGFGPKRDVVFAQGEESGKQVYWYDKYNSRRIEGPFRSLENWETVRSIMTTQPQPNAVGCVYELWRMTQDASCYEKLAGFFTRRVSMQQLLTELGTVS